MRGELSHVAWRAAARAATEEGGSSGMEVEVEERAHSRTWSPGT